MRIGSEFCASLVIVVLVAISGVAPPIGAEGHRSATGGQAFAPQAVAPGWLQDNADGFGDPANEMVTALVPFVGKLYAGTMRTGGGQVWAKDGDGAWSKTGPDGFGTPLNESMEHLIEFGGMLYAGTHNLDLESLVSNGGQVWRTDGVTWTQVVADGFGDPLNEAIFQFATFDGQLYASTQVFSARHGLQIFRSGSGDSGTWTRVVNDGFNGDKNNVQVNSTAVYSGQLYAATLNQTSGGELWRTANGTNWAQINADGFGSADNIAVGGLTEFGGHLYASTQNVVAGLQVWRCQLCDGTDWQQVVVGGLGNASNNGPNVLLAFQGKLYLVVGNATTGLQVWRTATGNNGEWEQAATSGLGDVNNESPHWKSATAGNGLYVGTKNLVTGGEVWKLMPHSVTLAAQKSG